MNSHEVKGTTRPSIYDTEQPGTSSFISMESERTLSSQPSVYCDPNYEHQLNFEIRSGFLFNTPLDKGDSFLADDSRSLDYLFASTEFADKSSASTASCLSCFTVASTAEQQTDTGNVRTLSGGFVLPSEMSNRGCSRTCEGCLWLARQGHRVTTSEVKKHSFFKGVTKEAISAKWKCEIRISRKLDTKFLTKRKLWLGTFESPCQAARALAVGRFLLSEKKKPSASEQLSSIPSLVEFRGRLRAQPLTQDLLMEAARLAQLYGKHGSLSVNLSGVDSVNNDVDGIVELKPSSS